MTRAAAAAAGRVSRLLRAFRRDERGNVAIIFGLAVLPLMAAAGLATDTMLAYTVEDQLQTSLDAAGLAAGRALEEEDVEPDALAFLRANFDAGPGLATLDDADVEVAVSEDGGRITLTATAEMPTRIMRLFGQETVTVNARTVINRETRGLELSLVLDITGSMVTDNKIGGLKTAVREMVDILYGDRETVRNLWVGMVPYIASVNVGTANGGFLRSGDRALGIAAAFLPDGWQGCVLARAAPYDQTDDPPSSQPFRSYLYPDLANSAVPNNATWRNDWGLPRVPLTRKYVAYSGSVDYWDGYGPNAGCPSPITPLTASKSAILAAVDELRPWSRGGTITSEGLAWGWRVISPRWRGSWSGVPATLPLNYTATNMDKVMVVMTDGDNQMLVLDHNGGKVSPYTTYESHVTLNKFSTADATAEIDRRTRNICTAIKAQGITVYTITFGAVPSAVGQALMRDCASQPSNYFHSPTSASLRTVFRQIGTQLSNLRIAE